MNELLRGQLQGLCHQMGWKLLHITNEDNHTVVIALGEELWLDELFSDLYAESE